MYERVLCAGISTLVRRMARPHVAVAVDGSVFKHHPRIARLMRTYIALLAPHHSVTLAPLLRNSLCAQTHKHIHNKIY